MVAQPGATARSFAGSNVGAIPDGLAGTPPQYGAPRDVRCDVFGMPAPLTHLVVEVTLTHTWVGDLDMVLISPGGAAQSVVVGHIGVTEDGTYGDDSDYGGSYVFSDGATGPNIWTMATAAGCGGTCTVPIGNYRATARGGPGQTNPPPVITLNAAFSGLQDFQINGLWTLRIRDGAAGDIGTVTSATLHLAGTNPALRAPADFNGDEFTDWAVVRNTGGAATWYWQNTAGLSGRAWGLFSDVFVPAMYDGDAKTDVAVWRPGVPGVWYVNRSTDLGATIFAFGQTNDDPTVVGDYDGDGRADYAVYRPGATVGAPSYWYAWRSSNNTLLGMQWGQRGDSPAPGDYDGDGKFDFCVRRGLGTEPAIFHLRTEQSSWLAFYWGVGEDAIVPGDYDGDGKTDIAVVRAAGPGVLQWHIRRSSDGGYTGVTFGSVFDYSVQGDYDRDGKTDIAVWRIDPDPALVAFYVLRSSDGSVHALQFGQSSDYPLLFFNTHR
jgi:hypothetical protein